MKGFGIGNGLTQFTMGAGEVNWRSQGINLATGREPLVRIDVQDHFGSANLVLSAPSEFSCDIGKRIGDSDRCLTRGISVRFGAYIIGEGFQHPIHLSLNPEVMKFYRGYIGTRIRAPGFEIIGDSTLDKHYPEIFQQLKEGEGNLDEIYATLVRAKEEYKSRQAEQMK